MLKKTRIIALLITIIFSLTTLASSCDDFIPEDKTIEAAKLGYEMIVEVNQDNQQQDDDKSVDDQASSEDQGEEKKEPEPTPAPAWDDEYTDKIPEIKSLDEFMTMFGLKESDKKKMAVHIDLRGNNLWPGSSEEEGIPESALPFSDILFTARATIQYPPLDSIIPGPDLFTCDYYNNELPLWVVCPDGLDTSGIDLWHVLVIGFGDNIPMTQESRYITIGAPMAASDDPSLLFTPMPEFPRDLFGGTSLWPLGKNQPGETWSAEAYDSSWNPVPLHFFIVFYKNLATFFISAADLDVELPSGRGTIDAADPQNYIANFSADAEGAGPTLGIFPWTAESKIVFMDEYEEIHLLPGGYELCQYGGCKFSDEGKTAGESNQMVSCECSGCTNNPDCECALIKDDYPFDYYHFWDYVAGQGQKTLLDPTSWYSCACIKKAP